LLAGPSMFSSGDREEFMEITKRIALANAKALEERAKGVLEEVEGLIDDAWNYEGKAQGESMQFYFFAILQPMVNGAYIDLLIGNLPAFFMELRLLLESLAYCYMAKFLPKDYPLDEIFQRVQRAPSTSKVLKEFGEISGLRDEPIKLWAKLSDDWCHALKIAGGGVKGVVPRAIEHFERHLMPPLPSIPLSYGIFWEETSYLVDEARKRTSEFRQILRSAIT